MMCKVKKRMMQATISTLKFYKTASNRKITDGNAENRIIRNGKVTDRIEEDKIIRKRKVAGGENRNKKFPPGKNMKYHK